MTTEMLLHNQRKAQYLELRLRVLAFALDHSEAFAPHERAALEEEAQTIEAVLDGMQVPA